MHRYRFAPCSPVVLGMSLLLGGCAFPGPQENVDAVSQLLVGQVGAALDWRRDAAADAAAMLQVDALLEGGLTLDESIAVAFLASPAPQLALEQLEVARADVVAAITPPNPVAVLGTRKAGGDLAAFYPEHNLSFGVLHNLIALLTMPDGKAIAGHELQRVRFEIAEQLATHAAQVAQAWLEYSAAALTHDLREQRLEAARAAIATLSEQIATRQVTEEQVLRERTDLFEIERDAARVAVELVTARNRLAELMGIGGRRDDWQVEAGLPDLPAEDPDFDAIEALALAQRFDLQAATTAIDTRLRVLATTRRFRWLNQFEVGVFREKAIGGAAFTGPNVVLEVPLFDQRQAQLLAADAELRAALRRLESRRQTALAEVRNRAAEVRATRLLSEQYDEQMVPDDHADAVTSPAGEGDLGQLQRRIGALAREEERVELLRAYWRARTSLAHAAADWGGVSGLP